MARRAVFAVLLAGLAGVSAFSFSSLQQHHAHRPHAVPLKPYADMMRPHRAPTHPFASATRKPVHLRAAVDEDDDLPARAVDFLTKSATFLNNDVKVPSFLVPARPSEKGKQTTLKGWYLFASGVSLTFGNVLFPASFLGYLYVSRPVEAPDLTAAVAAVLTTAVVSPLFNSLGDALDANDWPLARLPLLLGLVSTTWLLREVSKETEKAFVEPARAVKDPQAKSERDLRFFDVKLKSSSTGQGGDKPAEKKTVVVMSEKKEEPKAAPQPKAPQAPRAAEQPKKRREDERSGRWR